MSDSLERRIKRQILSLPQKGLIRFPRGLGDVCFDEVTELLSKPKLKGAATPKAQLLANAVAIADISLADLLAITLALTTGREVLWQVGGGRTDTAKGMQNRLAKMPWDLLLPAGCDIGLRISSTASRLFHEGRLRKQVEQALLSAGLTPKGVKGSQQLLDLRLVDNNLSVNLSLAGRPLYQRRYKTSFKSLASIKEDLAACATRLSLSFARSHFGPAWRPSEIVNPFAGSGTLGFEGTIAIEQIPPFIFFGPLAAESFPCCPTASLAHARRKAWEDWRAQQALQPPVPIRFIEISPAQCDALQENVSGFAKACGSSEDVNPAQVIQGDALQILARSPPLQDAFIAINPPYGDRLEVKSSAKSFARLGESCQGSRLAGYAFLPSAEVANTFLAALKPNQASRRQVSNGGLAVQLVTFVVGS